MDRNPHYSTNDLLSNLCHGSEEHVIKRMAFSWLFFHQRKPWNMCVDTMGKVSKLLKAEKVLRSWCNSTLSSSFPWTYKLLKG
ncbi:hypothetical protein HZ326_1138 [Fusarium oxysporum f. sp. albedinis]|nr:hypothetical protein HZ326_1138 [Fusarium oxysporum f. sp. albedinis]